MSKLKFFFKFIFLFTLIILIAEFFLFLSFHDSKKFDFSNEKKIIVKLFNLKYSKENKTNINKLVHLYHPYIGWVHPANSQIYTGKKCLSDIFLSTDDFGNSLIPNNYENPDFNLVFTGASNAFGVGSSNNDNTIPSLIQKEFAENNIKVNFYNLAIRGIQSFQEFQRLYEFLALSDKKIDLVISLSMRNDADFASYQSDSKYSLHPKYSHELTNKINKILSHEHYVNNSIFFKNILLDNFYFFDVFYKNFKEFIKVENHKTFKSAKNINFANFERKVAISAKNYDLMFQTAKMFGADYMLLPQPLSYTKKLTSNEKKCFYLDEQSMKYQVSFYAKLFKKFKNKKYFYNISDIFDSLDEDIYIDCCHFNDRGAKIIAKRVYKVIDNEYNFINQ